MRTIDTEAGPVWVFGGEDGTSKPIVWVLGQKEETARRLAELAQAPCVLACVSSPDWNRDFSPWPAPALRAQDEGFAGGADGYLTLLTQRVLPCVEKTLCAAPACRALAGYSLAGLFAVYALCRTELFAQAASVSGSLWYDGFLAWALQNAPPKGARLYFSLGDREAQVRNARMARVEACTEELAAYWAKTNPVVWEKNTGGHFAQPEKRMARAVEVLCTPEGMPLSRRRAEES